jgi:hypothetical protein
MYTSDDDWDEILLTGSNLLLKVREQTKTVAALALGIKNWWRIF